MITVTYRLSDTDIDGMKEILVSPLSFKPLPKDMPTGIFIDPAFFRRGGIYPTRRLRGMADMADSAKESKLCLDRFTRVLINIIRVTEDLVAVVTEDHIRLLMQKEADGELEKEGDWITMESAANALGIKSEGLTYTHHRNIQDYFLEYAMRTRMSEHAHQVHNVYSRHMIRFELYQQRVMGRKGFELSIDRISTEDIAALQHFVKTEAEIWESNKEVMDEILEETDMLLPRRLKSKPCKTDGQLDVDMMFRIKAVINWLRDVRKEITESPFTGLELGRHIGDKIPVIINEEEIQMLLSLDLKKTPSFDILRDVFVFQCKTGVRLRDVTYLDRTNIHEGNILRYEPKPILNEIYSPENEVQLDDTCMAIIKKHEREDYRGRLFTCVSQLRHEALLSAIFKHCGLDRPVLVHDPKARKEKWVPLYRKASTRLAEATYYYTKSKNRPSVPVQDRRMTKKQRDILYNEVNKL